VRHRPAGALGALLLVCLCLTGCSGLFHSNAKPEQIYYLRAPPAQSAAADGAAAASPATNSAAAAPMPVSVRVGRPVANPGLDSPHIMLLQTDHRMNFYTGSRWPGPAPEVVEALAVQTLRASGAWSSVEDSASPFPSDYLLQLHLRRFEADYTEGGAAPTVRVVLDCIIGRRQGREVLATFTASGAATASANRLAEVVGAFEQATGTALEQLSQQAVQTVRADLQRSAAN
jgi:cholesterol transport system auxiliary component